MTLNTVTTIDDLRHIVKSWRQADETLALVPTMGNLHDGHLKLVEEAQQQSQRVIVSIFVNPTQFGPDEDCSAYPRTAAEDYQKLEQMGIDLLFLPEVETLYVKGSATVVEVQGLSEQYCGLTRPGHFAGVATIVCKLFNIVQPDFAYFGEKDFQQLAVIGAMVRDLNIPIQIKGIATVRESDGLAMSSRNGYLTDQQRQIAPKLFQTLQAMHQVIKSGCDDFNGIVEQQLENLRGYGFQPDYLAICRRSDLKPACADDTDLVILVAAKLGKTRLIDNIIFNSYE
jgi:pantoate--beta-alanine ligase